MLTGESAALLEGTVETNTGVGAAAQLVTVSGSGLLLHFAGYGAGDLNAYDEVLGQSSLTLSTDVDGKFYVYVYSHKVGTQTITITSGGKSTTVTLVSKHNVALLDDVDNNKLTWNFPKRPGVGVTPATVTFTDKWGNPVAGASIDFDGESNMQSGNFAFIDGIPSDEYDSTFYKVTDARGQISVRIRPFSIGRLQAPGTIEVEVVSVNNTLAGQTFNTNEGGNVTDIKWSGFFGTQATAVAGANSGVVVVKAFNAAGRKVHVFAGARLVTTVDATKRVETIRVKVKSGDRNISVRVGKNLPKNTLLSKVVTVK
jgi:hypothetical protein